MNILLASSSHDGPSWVAFNLESLNLKLEHHKNLYDAIQSCLESSENDFKNKDFGSIISTSGKDLYEDSYFIEYMLKAECEFSDSERQESTLGYTNISLKPPFHIDAVINLTTFG